jgi:putative lipoprotein (rSAM/lipoprotein system)
MITRFTARFLSLIGMFLGFTSEVLAQYGAPVYFFSVKGNVKDIECQNPVKNAKVKLINRETNTEYDARTDSLGNFSFIEESYYHNPAYFLKIEDPDGKSNCHFKTFESNAPLKTQRGYHFNAANDTIPPDIYLVEFVSGSNCDKAIDTLEQEPAKEPEPTNNIQQQDSTGIMEENLGITPEAEDPFTSVNLFPNPNSGKFAVEFVAIGSGNTIISIFDANGSLLHYSEMNIEASFNSIELNMPMPAPGNYYCTIQNRAGRITMPFVVD